LDIRKILSFERILVFALILLFVSYLAGFFFAAFLPIQTAQRLDRIGLFPLLSFTLKHQYPEISTVEVQRLFLTTLLFFGTFFLTAPLMVVSGFFKTRETRLYQLSAESTWSLLFFDAVFLWLFYFPDFHSTHSGRLWFIAYSDYRYFFMTCGFVFMLFTCFVVGRVFGNLHYPPHRR
jgi:hypothetical protein